MTTCKADGYVVNDSTESIQVENQGFRYLKNEITENITESSAC
jgi:hypothetical protein